MAQLIVKQLKCEFDFIVNVEFEGLLLYCGYLGKFKDVCFHTQVTILWQRLDENWRMVPSEHCEKLVKFCGC